jgi:hypothetical protein
MANDGLGDCLFYMFKTFPVNSAVENFVVWLDLLLLRQIYEQHT